MLATLLLIALAVAMLYVGREIFIPIAIAILLSFVLSPPVLLLRHLGLGRVPSVLTVVLAALIIAFSVSAVLTRQVSELAVDLPLYQGTINAKLDDLRDAAADNALFAKVSAALKKLGEINPHRPAPSSAPAPTDQPKNQLTKGQESERPIPVEVRSADTWAVLVAGRHPRGQRDACCAARLIRSKWGGLPRRRSPQQGDGHPGGGKHPGRDHYATAGPDRRLYDRADAHDYADPM